MNSPDEERLPQIKLVYTGFSEPDYLGNESIVALADWKQINRNTQELLLEREMELLSRDEWDICTKCSGLIRIQPNSLAWQFFGWRCDGKIICGLCVHKDPLTYLRWHEGRHDKCTTIYDLEPSDYDYVLVCSNLKMGKNADPETHPVTTAKRLAVLGRRRFIIRLNSADERSAVFSIYLHKDDLRS